MLVKTVLYHMQSCFNVNFSLRKNSGLWIMGNRCPVLVFPCLVSVASGIDCWLRQPYKGQASIVKEWMDGLYEKSLILNPTIHQFPVIAHLVQGHNKAGAHPGKYRARETLDRMPVSHRECKQTETLWVIWRVLEKTGMLRGKLCKHLRICKLHTHTYIPLIST